MRGSDGVGIDVNAAVAVCRDLAGEIEGATGDTDREDGIGGGEDTIERSKIFEAGALGAGPGCGAAVFGSPNDANAARDEAGSDGSAHFTGV